MKAIKIIMLIILLQIPFQVFSTTTIEMSVGEKRTISLSNPPYYLKGCIWTTTHPDDVVFDPHPGSYSTSVTIKAVNPTAPNRCVIHCEYKYLELDPTTGRYTYQRSGFEDWYVYVKANDPTSVQISPSSSSVFVGERIELKATVYPSNASTKLEWWLEKAGGDAFFTQTYQDIIHVTGQAPGIVYANVKTSNGLTARCPVNVLSKDPTSISLNGPSSMIVGEEKTLTPSIEPYGATATLSWESSKPDVIEVNNGVIKALSTGTSRITVTTHNGKSAYCDIQVKNAPTKPTSIRIPSNLTIYNTMSQRIDVTLEPEDAETTYRWTTSDNSVATVSSSGQITGKKVGVATITVTTANNLSASCEVTVIDMPAGLTSSIIQSKINNINRLLDRTISNVPNK